MHQIGSMGGWKAMSTTKKIMTAGFGANVFFIATMVVCREWKKYAKEEERLTQKKVRELTQDFKCYFAARQYYQECRQDMGTSEICKQVTSVLQTCQDELYTKIPPVTPAMSPLPVAFR